MIILAQLSQLLGLVSLLALIWLVVRGFKKHWLWGLAVLFLSPISGTIFGIKYWSREKIPFLSYITTFIPAVALGFYVFSTLGGWSVAQNSLNLQKGGRSEMLTEQDALAFMHSNLDFIGKTITQDGDQKKIDMMRNYLQKFESGMSEEDMRELNREMLELALSSAENLTEEQRRQLEELRENVIPGESVSTDIQSKSSQNISGTNNETENTTRKYPSPAPRLRMKLVKIQVSDAKDFIGKTVKVKTIDGIDRTYRLIASSPNSLSFERREQGGMLTFEMERRNIRELKVFTRQPLR